MIRALIAEFLKLKRSPILWVSTLGIAALPALNGLAALLSSGKMDWSTFLSQNLTLVGLLTGTLVFGLVASYIFGRELVEGTAKNIFTVPVARHWTLLAKLLVLLVWTLALMLFMWLISLLIGFIVGLEEFSWNDAIHALPIYLDTALIFYLTLPLTGLVALFFRNYIPAIAFAVVAMMTGALGYSSQKYSPWIPWAIPTRFAEGAMTATEIYFLLALFAVSVLAHWIYLRKMDIHQ